ncbi:hypothetical protein JCM10212_000885 [Sporobolomyces blumeae]
MAMSLSDVKTIDDVEAMLEEALLLVPSGTNPFTFLRETLASSVSYTAPKSSTAVLIIASVLLGVVSLVLGAAFVVRWKRRMLWWFRLVRVGRESYILGSMGVLKGGGDLVFSLALQVSVWFAHQSNQGDRVPHRLLAIILPWIPGAVAASLALWCLAVAYILHMRTYVSATSKVPWYFASLPVNVVGSALSFVISASSIVPAVLASRDYERGLDKLETLGQTLKTFEAVWTPKLPVSYAMISSSAPTVFSAIEDLHQSEHYFKTTFLVLMVWCAVLGLSFVVVGLAYGSAINRSLAELRGRSTTGVGLATFTQTRRWLVLITCMFAIVMGSVTAHAAWIAHFGARLLTEGVLNELAISLPLYTVALLGIPVAVMLFANAYSTPTSTLSLAGSIDGSSSRSQADHGASSTSSWSKPPRALSSTELAQHYTLMQFRLAASLPLPARPFLGFGLGADDDADPSARGRVREAPFESLELDAREGSGDRDGSKADGIVVLRGQEVTVIALPKEAGGLWSAELDEHESKW